MEPNIDLITCARDLLLQLPVEVNIAKEWVKEHYVGEQKQLKHLLNNMADKLAVDYNMYHCHTSTMLPVPSPLSEIELLHGGAIITSRMTQVIKEARHADNLCTAILDQTGWTQRTLELVDFECHKQAYNSHSRPHRVSICILIHGLYQTKLRDHRFYGTHPTCPCYQAAEESLCHGDLPSRNWAHHLQLLTLSYMASRAGPPHNMTPVFIEQTKTLGGDQFLHGRVSLKWGKAFSSYKSIGKQTNIDSTAWVNS
jgi:hypothetical protein